MLQEQTHLGRQRINFLFSHSPSSTPWSQIWIFSSLLPTSNQWPNLLAVLPQYLMHSFFTDISTTLIGGSQAPVKDEILGHNFICCVWIHIPKARLQPQVVTKWWVVESFSRNLLQAQRGDDDPRALQSILEWLSVWRNVWMRNLIFPKTCPRWPHPLRESVGLRSIDRVGWG